MNSRERVLAAINHKEPDRVPVDLGATAGTGINVSAYIRLCHALGLPTDDVRVYDVFAMTAAVDLQVLDAIGGDVLPVPSLTPRFGLKTNAWKPWRLFDGTPVKVPRDLQTAEEPDGALLLMVDGKAVGKMPRNGFYFSELAQATMGGLDALTDPPHPDTQTFATLSDEDLAFRQTIAKRLHQETDKALFVEVMDNIRWNTSIANWLYAFAADPQRTNELHHKKSLNVLERVKQLAQAVGPYVQVFGICQDFGTQKSEVVSPDKFARLVAPHYKRVFDWIHANTTWKVWFHSCGSIYRLIPHMIEMGVDILNPVQCNAAGMDARRLKESFGDRLVFWGGGVDTQTTLPFGTPDAVKQQVRERLSAFAPGGGYVFAPSQDIQADVPVENLMAMYGAVREWGKYPIAAN